VITFRNQRAHKVTVPDADTSSVNLDELPAWADPVAEPFRRDPAFWRAVYASADALALIVVAGAASVLIGRLGGSPVVSVVPFLLPLLFLGWALMASYRSSRASRVWFRRHDGDGLSTWRESERQAVASVFVRALVRNRLRHP
jgi:hypothetical protein